MKKLGILLLAIGTIWAVVAFNTDTTVTTESQSFGGIYIPSQTVHNIGKMDERRNHLMLSALVVVVGVILFAVGSKSSSNPAQPEGRTSPIADTRKCPFCAELIKVEAIICKHCRANLPEYKPESNEPAELAKLQEEKLAMEKSEQKREKQLLESYSMGHQLSLDDVDFLKKRGITT